MEFSAELEGVLSSWEKVNEVNAQILNDSKNYNEYGKVIDGALTESLCHEELFENLCSVVRLDNLKDLIHTSIKCLKQHSFHYPGFLHASSDLFPVIVLLRNAYCDISLWTVNAANLQAHKLSRTADSGRVVRFSCAQRSIKILKGSLRVTAWEVSQRIRSDLAHVKKTIARPKLELILSPGDCFTTDGYCESLVVEEVLETGVLILQLEDKRNKGNGVVSFNSSTGQVSNIASNYRTASVLQMSANFIAASGTQSERKELLSLLDHPVHFVRWSVMRVLLVTGGEEFIHYLETMSVSDPHPDVRSAAKKTLKNLLEKTLAN